MFTTYPKLAVQSGFDFEGREGGTEQIKFVDRWDLSSYASLMKKITDYDDPAALRRVRKNALETADKALRQLSLLEAGKQRDKMYSDYYQALAAYEQLLIETVHPSARASRTREALAKRSLEDCLEEWAGAKTPTKAFELLTQFGLVDMTAERIVLRYSDRFSKETLATAKKRLDELKS